MILMSLNQLANLFRCVRLRILTSENILQCKVNHPVIGWIPGDLDSGLKVQFLTAQIPHEQH